MKMKKEQLVESIRDIIYEVLEEELDRKLQEAKKAKSTKSLQEARLARQKAARVTLARRKAAQLKEAKIQKMREIVRSHDAQSRKAAPSRAARRAPARGR